MSKIAGSMLIVMAILHPYYQMSPTIAGRTMSWVGISNLLLLGLRSSIRLQMTALHFVFLHEAAIIVIAL